MARYFTLPLLVGLSLLTSVLPPYGMRESPPTRARAATFFDPGPQATPEGSAERQRAAHLRHQRPAQPHPGQRL